MHTIDFEAFADKNHWFPWKQPLAILASQPVNIIDVDVVICRPDPRGLPASRQTWNGLGRY
jgi:hypothetical protein